MESAFLQTPGMRWNNYDGRFGQRKANVGVGTFCIGDSQADVGRTS